MGQLEGSQASSGCLTGDGEIIVNAQTSLLPCDLHWVGRQAARTSLYEIEIPVSNL